MKATNGFTLAGFSPLELLVLLLAGIAIGFSQGCATTGDPAKPRTAAEEFPLRNQDPRVGLLVNSGTAPSNIYIYDQANRLVEQTYMSGGDRFLLQSNGQPYPQYWIRTFEPGCYRIDVYPFYNAIRILPAMKYRVDMPKQSYGMCVGNNPTAYYYGGRHWSWLLQIGINIPEGATGLPMVQVRLPL